MILSQLMRLTIHNSCISSIETQERLTYTVYIFLTWYRWAGVGANNKKRADCMITTGVR